MIWCLLKKRDSEQMKASEDELQQEAREHEDNLDNNNNTSSSGAADGMMIASSSRTAEALALRSTTSADYFLNGRNIDTLAHLLVYVKHCAFSLSMLFPVLMTCTTSTLDLFWKSEDLYSRLQCSYHYQSVNGSPLPPPLQQRRVQ